MHNYIGAGTVLLVTILTSVTDPGCLSRILDPNFSIPDPGSKVKKIPDPGSASASKSLSRVADPH